VESVEEKGEVGTNVVFRRMLTLLLTGMINFVVVIFTARGIGSRSELTDYLKTGESVDWRQGFCRYNEGLCLERYNWSLNLELPTSGRVRLSSPANWPT
jgi:hypothetical protein